MNELIKISEQNGKQAVSARELHSFLESKRDFSNWIKDRIEKYGFIENQDFEILLNFEKNSLDSSLNNFGERTGRGGNNKIEYALTIDAAKELSMVEGNEKGKQARKYFIECEKELKKALPKDYLSALKALVASEEEKQLALERAVKAENTVSILTHVNKTYTVTEIAKELGLKSAIELNKILAERKIQYQSNGTWVLYSNYSDQGYEEIKQEVLDNGHVIYHRKITQRGREFILNIFNQQLKIA